MQQNAYKNIFFKSRTQITLILLLQRVELLAAT